MTLLCEREPIIDPTKCPQNTTFSTQKPPRRTAPVLDSGLSRTLADKATPLGGTYSRPVAHEATLSPSEGPPSPFQISSRPVRRETWAARGCMAVTADLDASAASEPRWPKRPRNPQPGPQMACLPPYTGGSTPSAPPRFPSPSRSHPSTETPQVIPFPSSRFSQEVTLSDWNRPNSAKQLIEQEQYSRQIVQWLDKQFPELEGHPAAVVAVINLHHMLGRGKVTRAQHGAQILRAVAAFDKRWGTGA
jgi:hypothetical protein